MKNAFCYENEDMLASDSSEDDVFLFGASYSDLNRNNSHPPDFKTQTAGKLNTSRSDLQRHNSVPQRKRASGDKKGYLFLDETSSMSLLKKLLLKLKDNSSKPTQTEYETFYETLNQFLVPQIVNSTKKAFYAYNILHSSNIVKALGIIVVNALNREISRNGPATDFAVFLTENSLDILNKLLYIFFQHIQEKIGKEHIKTYSPSLIYFTIGEINRKNEREDTPEYYDKAIKPFIQHKGNKDIENLIDLAQVYEAKAKFVKSQSGNLEEVSKILFEGFLKTKNEGLKNNVVACLNQIFSMEKGKDK